jgi:hypothetical protein
MPRARQPCGCRARGRQRRRVPRVVELTRVRELDEDSARAKRGGRQRAHWIASPFDTLNVALVQKVAALRYQTW